MNRAGLRSSLVLFAVAALWIMGTSGRADSKEWRVSAVLSSGAAPYREFLDGFAARFTGQVETTILDSANPAMPMPGALPPDLILALGSSAAALAADDERDEPVFFGMVYYPRRHKLVGREKVAGISLRAPPEVVVEALDSLKPEGKKSLRVGLVYPEDGDGEEPAEIEKALAKSGHVLVIKRAGAEKDLAPAFNELLKEVDVLWLTAEPSVLPDPRFLQSVLKAALDRKVAVIGLSDAHVRGGALFAMSVDYRLEGESAARAAMEILAGKKPSDVGVLPPSNLYRSLNTKVAEEIGWPIARATRQRFERVYP